MLYLFAKISGEGIEAKQNQEAREQKKEDYIINNNKT
jgi:hypothetical protein